MTSSFTEPHAGASPLMMVPTPPPAPDIPAGWRTGPPDFVGVGAQRSGTTWWWSVISSHPDVALAGVDSSALPQEEASGVLLRALNQKKELHFFDQYGDVTDIDPALYHRHFPRPPGKIVGEWTPRYMYDFWTPAMLRQVAPDTRILVMLRDPLERFMSGLAHSIRMAEVLGFELDAESFVRHENFGRGQYWWQLQNVLRHFDRDRVLVLQYEQCVADVVRQARRTFAFLGLDPGRWDAREDVSRPAGPPSGPKTPFSDRASAALRLAYQHELELLFANFAELDPSLWPSACLKA